MTTARVCLVTPYPPGETSLGGGGWVDRRLISALRQAEVDLTVVCVTGRAGRWVEDGVTYLSRGDVPLEVRRDRRALVRVVGLMARSTKPYLAAKFSVFAGWHEAAGVLAEAAAGRRVITSGWPPLLLADAADIPVAVHVVHNVDSVIAAEHAPRPLRLLGELPRMRRLERRLLARPVSLLSLSRTDVGKLRQWGVAAAVLPLPLDPGPARLEAGHAVGFIGKATWPPNAQALATLLGPVHDRLVALDHPVRYVLAGVGSEQLADHPRVDRAGWIDDVEPFYRDVGLVVVPRLGVSTGISVKVLEAAEHGVAAVVPRSLAEAIDPDGPWHVADDAATIADAIVAWAAGDRSADEVRAWARAQRPAETAAALLTRL